mgnify:CR=1 FL=1
MNLQNKYVQKGFIFLIIFIICMFLNRVFSFYFSPNASSIFTFFAGSLINYTALFFVFLIMALFNFRNAVDDERMITAFDILIAFIIIFTFFLVFFPALSIRLSYIHLPVRELILIGLLSFLGLFIETDQSINFHKRLSWRILFFLIMPYSILVYIKYPPRLILFSMFGKNYPLYFVIVFLLTIITALIIQVFNKTRKIFIPVLINALFFFLAVNIYLVIFPVAGLVNVQRTAYVLFYVSLIPVVVMFMQKIKVEQFPVL